MLINGNCQEKFAEVDANEGKQFTMKTTLSKHEKIRQIGNHRQWLEHR